MGGGANSFANVLADVGSLGLNQIDPNIRVIPALYGAEALTRGAGGAGTFMNAGKDAAIRQGQMQGTILGQQQDAADKAARTALEQPKSISPDNYLSDKLKQIKNLRLGLASTISPSGGAPGGVSSAPSLAASGPGKKTFGS